MFRVTLAAALVSIVSGCVTSGPGPVSSQATKPRQFSHQATQTSAGSFGPNARPAIILGAAY